MGWFDDISEQVKSATGDAGAQVISSAGDWFSGRISGQQTAASNPAAVTAVAGTAVPSANKISSWISAHLFLVAAVCLGGILVLVVTGRGSREGKK